MPTTIFKVYLAGNIFCLLLYTAMLIYAGLATDGDKRVGLLSGFGTAQGYAISFFLFLMFVYFTPLSSQDRSYNCVMLTFLISMVLYLIAIVVVIITGSQLDGYWRIALVVGGSVALIHYFGFILLIMILFGTAAARG